VQRSLNGEQPVFGGNKKFQTDPFWRDNILFYEYFHGDNGAGLGSSHQTGWTGLVAKSIQLFSSIDGMPDPNTDEEALYLTGAGIGGLRKKLMAEDKPDMSITQ